MKPILKDELQSELKEISGILFTAQESFKLVTYLLKDEEDEDLVYEKRVNAFLSYSVNIHWRTTVIELCKLLADKKMERFNLHKFIHKLKHYFIETGIESSDILKWESLLLAEEDSIKNLIDQRDKVYAHTDSSHREFPNTITLNKARELITFIQQLIRKLYSVVFETAYQIEEPINSPIIGLEHLLKLVVEAKKTKRESWRPIAKEYGLEKEI
jgi:hypothetical protein